MLQQTDFFKKVLFRGLGKQTGRD